jgi:hypothetical protein
MREVAKKLTQQLKGEHLDETLSVQVIKNLVFIGKCFSLVPFEGSTTGQDLDEDILESEIPMAPGERVKSMDQPLPWLFSVLSYQIRSAHISRTSRAVMKVRVLSMLLLIRPEMSTTLGQLVPTTSCVPPLVCSDGGLYGTKQVGDLPRAHPDTGVQNNGRRYRPRYANGCANCLSKLLLINGFF